MDPRPFRCVYDPELVKAAGGVQQGTKPVFAKARLGVTQDPRRGGPAAQGRRVMPLQLPPANFARRRPREARVHLSNLGPLVTRMQVNDAACFFGNVKSCDVVIARSTNASLGVASVVFGGEPAAALRSAEQIVAACGRGSLTIGGVRGVRAAMDSSRALLREAETQADTGPAAAPPDRVDPQIRPLSPSPDDLDVQLVELRTLTNQQVDEWYRRFIGPAPTYVLIPHHNVSPLSCSVREVASRFRDHAYLRIAANRTGFFVLFDSAERAERCFAALDGKRFMNTKLRLALTRGGERIHASELRNIRQRRYSDAPPEWSAAARAKAAPERPSQLNSEDLLEVGKAGVDALLNDMKRQAWNLFVRRTVVNAVKKAVEERQMKAKTEAEQTAAPVTPESEVSEPEASYKSAFGMRQTLRETGKTSRPLPTVRLRKRAADPVDVKPRKVLKRETVAPKTYIRDARRQKGAHDNEDVSDDEELSDEYEEDDDYDDGVDKTASNENKNTKGRSRDIRSADATDLVAATSALVTKMEIDEEEELVEEKEEPEPAPFLLPPSPPPETYETLDFKAFKQLVRTPEDFASLQTVLHSAGLPPISEEEVLARFGRRRTVKLDYAPPNWPDQALPFREAPFRVRSDEERRSYLPVADSGLPNEIVQNYKYRPLYEEEEDEEDPSKVELRKDARVLSRSSFGTGSDLFADDTLSKNVKDVRLARSSIHDWGLYANENIPEGEFVIEYVGDILRDEYADVRERNYMMEGIDSSYLFRLDNGTVIDATKRGNGARFINHSCDPNCVAQVFDYDGFKRVVLFSVRDIRPDEELTFDYNFVRAQDDEGKVRCACGAANCRGWLI